MKLGLVPTTRNGTESLPCSGGTQGPAGFRGTLFNPLHRCSLYSCNKHSGWDKAYLSPFLVENVCLEGLTSDHLDSSHSPLQQAKKDQNPHKKSLLLVHPPSSVHLTYVPVIAIDFFKQNKKTKKTHTIY